MNWCNQFWDCPLIRGIYQGRNPISQMKVNRAFYKALNKRPITKLMECDSKHDCNGEVRTCQIKRKNQRNGVK